MYLVIILFAIVLPLCAIIDMKYFGGKDGLGRKPRIKRNNRARKRS
jgi:hypothetical protein